MWIYLADVNGDPSGDATCGAGEGNSKCVVYEFDGVNWTHDGSVFLWDPRTANTCLGNGELDSVGVRMTSHYDPITELFPFLQDLVLTEKTVMNLEPSTSVLKDCS
jgi:microcystin degradation protein MlrC